MKPGNDLSRAGLRLFAGCVSSSSLPEETLTNGSRPSYTLKHTFCLVGLLSPARVAHRSRSPFLW
jgi:hypothetical protein